MDHNRTSRLARLISTPPIRLSPVLASIVAGVLGGVVARVIAELMLMSLILFVYITFDILPYTLINTGITDYVSEFTIDKVLFGFSALLSGMSGGFAASEISRRLSQRAGNLRRWRWAWSVTGLVVWSLVTWFGYIYFDDWVSPPAPHPWRSVVLWPLSGAIVGGVLGVLFLNRRSTPSPAA